MRPSDWRRTVAEQGGDRKPRTSGENPLMAGAFSKLPKLGRLGRFWTVLENSPSTSVSTLPEVRLYSAAR